MHIVTLGSAGGNREVTIGQLFRLAHRRPQWLDAEPRIWYPRLARMTVNSRRLFGGGFLFGGAVREPSIEDE